MRRLKKILIGVVAFFVVFTLVGFFVLPPILKSILVKKLSENLHREVTIDQIKVNPYVLSATLRGFKVKDRAISEIFISFDELYFNLQSLSLLKQAIIIKEIRLSQPFIKISRNQDLSYNFSDLIEKKETRTETVKKAKPFKTVLYPIELKVNHFSNGKDKKTAYALSISSEAKENVKLEGELSVEPSWAEGGLEIKSVPLKKYSPYYQDRILFNIEQGDLDLFTNYQYSKTEKETL
jgi:hypothetical protein